MAEEQYNTVLESTPKVPSTSAPDTPGNPVESPTIGAFYFYFCDILEIDR